MRLCKGGTAVLCTCLLTAGGAGAQAGKGARPATALALPVRVLAAGVSVAQATAEQKKAAQQKFEQGSTAFQEKRWDEAIASFRASYDVVASPNTYVMLGRALRGAGRRVEAYEALLEAVDRARELAKSQARYAKAAEVAEVELGQLRAEIALVSVRIEGVDGADVVAGERPIAVQQYSGFAVEPGQVRVVARAADGRSAEQVVVTEAGGSHEAVLRFAAPRPAPAPTPAPAPVPEPPPSPPMVAGSTLPPGPDSARFDFGPSTPPSSLAPWAWVATGVGVAGLATFTAAGLMARSTERDLEDACGARGVCPDDVRDDVDRGKREQTVANIGLVVGLVGVATGVTLFVIDSNRDETVAKPEPAARRLTVHVSPGFTGLRGKF